MWSLFRRWSANGTWGCVVAALHEQARLVEGRVERKPQTVVIDTHLARGASNGGVTFHDRGGPYGRTNAALRVAVDACGLPLAGRVVAASTPQATASEMLLEDRVGGGQAKRLELVLVDRGTLAKAAQRLSRRFGLEVRRFGLEVRRVGWDEPERDERGRKLFRPIRFAWRVEVAHGLLGRLRLARSFENTCRSKTASTSVACALVLAQQITSERTAA